jgi:hypothetical protein
MQAAVIIALIGLVLSIGTTVALCAFFLGVVKADLGRLNEWADMVGPKIVETQTQVAYMKGRMEPWLPPRT